MARKSVQSERLQMQQLQKANPEDFEVPDHCVLFFPSEIRYSLTELKSLLTEDPEVMSVVSVKDGKRKYKATLMHIGTQADCELQMAELEKRLVSRKGKAPVGAPGDTRGGKKSAVGKELDDEITKLDMLTRRLSDEDSTLYTVDEEVEELHVKPQFDDEWKKDVNKKLDVIMGMLKELLKKQHRVHQTTRQQEETDDFLPQTPLVKRIKVAKREQETDEQSDETAQPSSPLVYNGTNLRAISSGGEIKKYALKIFKVLFTDDEMAQGMVGPIQRSKTEGKTTLDESRVSLLKQAVREKFGDTLDKKWAAIRQCLNQKCLDVRRKMKSAQDLGAGANDL